MSNCDYPFPFHIAFIPLSYTGKYTPDRLIIETHKTAIVHPASIMTQPIEEVLGYMSSICVEDVEEAVKQSINEMQALDSLTTEKEEPVTSHLQASRHVAPLLKSQLTRGLLQP